MLTPIEDVILSKSEIYWDRGMIVLVTVSCAVPLPPAHCLNVADPMEHIIYCLFQDRQIKVANNEKYLGMLIKLERSNNFLVSSTYDKSVYCIIWLTWHDLGSCTGVTCCNIILIDRISNVCWVSCHSVLVNTISELFLRYIFSSHQLNSKTWNSTKLSYLIARSIRYKVRILVKMVWNK